MSWRRKGLVSGALLGGWGCLPPTALPPPVPGGGARGADVGVSGGIELETDACPLTQQPDGSWQEDCRSTVRLPPMGSLFYAQRLSPTWEVGGAVFWSSQFGEGFPSGAAFARRSVLQTDRVRVGGHAELGFASVGVGIPAAVRVRDPLWLHSLPRVATSMMELDPGLSGYQTELSLPLGLSYALSPTLLLTAEASMVKSIPRGAMPVWAGPGGQTSGRALGAVTYRMQRDD